MKVWMTLNGTEIPYKKLEDSHLVSSILSYICLLINYLLSFL